MTDKFKSIPVLSSEITPKSLYLSRRDFLKAAGILTGTALLAACAPKVSEQTADPGTEAPAPSSAGKVDELGDPANAFEEITNYNNFYEFSTDKQAVAGLSKGFTTEPWAVEVGGLVNNPKTYGIEDLLKLFPQEERIYRLRCVEAWSMVIPWNGFPLASLLNEVEPTSDAKYVRFESVDRPDEMPGQKSPFYSWPYQEGLRLDEAMNDLTILATGLYGEMMPNQNGAPIRLVVPWKYGFKSIKSIVKIELVDYQPETLWNTAAPNEYGFYSNVNPQVSHPRWSQNTERRIGELGRRATHMFNGYAEQVAYLYEGMDLAKFY
ncbi:MAG: protein-methionine-sulfoxide reductase catalytic subunit MsrP [Anaerolineales bacterium]|nr:protein-methionine-sulfoxide reductase catalytic subunit MsrP [Anaerolineales bacterium]